MLRRFLFSCLCAFMAFAAKSAQLTATLQSGDKMTPFYGADAFVNALDAAVDGDIITLSPGTFTSAQIKKSVTVIGASAFSDDYTYFSGDFKVYADNVSIEGLRFYNLYINATDNLRIDRCYFTNGIYDDINGDKKYHTNTIIKDSQTGDFGAMEYSKNLVLRNCYIGRFYDMNESGNPALIENCNVKTFASYFNALESPYKRPYAIYRNCRLGFYKFVNKNDTPTISFYSPSEFHNNQFIYNYEDSSSTSSWSKKWSISYGSCIHEGNVDVYKYSVSFGDRIPNSFSADGIYGPQNHKSEPAIPNIESSNIDTETDADGNLHVKITAVARD